MFKELRKHPADYLMLVSVLAVFFFGFFAVWPNVLLQQSFALAIALAYFLWGIMHHRNEKSLTARIVLEYFFVSLFAGSVLFLLTL